MQNDLLDAQLDELDTGEWSFWNIFAGNGAHVAVLISAIIQVTHALPDNSLIWVFVFNIISSQMFSINLFEDVSLHKATSYPGNTGRSTVHGGRPSWHKYPLCSKYVFFYGFHCTYFFLIRWRFNILFLFTIWQLFSFFQSWFTCTFGEWRRLDKTPWQKRPQRQNCLHCLQVGTRLMRRTNDLMDSICWEYGKVANI